MNSGTKVERTIKNLTEIEHIFVFNWFAINEQIKAFLKGKNVTIFILDILVSWNLYSYLKFDLLIILILMLLLVYL